MTPFARPGAAAPPAAAIAPIAVGFELSGGVAADYRVEITEPGRPPRSVAIRVEFPDDARSLLETISWAPGGGIVALLEHVSHDKLVLWGWDPGVGRAPVDVPHKDFVAAFQRWTEAGAPCPGS